MGPASAGPIHFPPAVASIQRVPPEEWTKDLAPFVGEAFAKLIPVKVAKAAQEKGVVPRALTQIVGE